MNSMTQSGYSNVDVLPNQDILTDQGYEFKPCQTKVTVHSRASVGLTIASKIPPEMTRKSASIIPPKPVIEPYIKAGKKEQRKAIRDAALNTLHSQLEYNQKVAEYNKELREAEKLEEQEKIRYINSKYLEEEAEKKAKSKELSEQYKKQALEAELHHQREMEVEAQNQAKLEAERRTQKDFLDTTKEDKLKSSLKRREDYLAQSREIEKQREYQKDREADDEARIQKEAAEMDALREARDKEDERRRFEKTKIRSAIVDKQLHELEIKKKATVKQEETSADDAQTEKDMALLTRLVQKEKKDKTDMKGDWMELQKEKEMKRKHMPKKDFPIRKESFDDEQFEMEQKKAKNLECRKEQERQAEEKRKSLKEEQRKELELDKTMLQTTKQELNTQIEKLQTLVPKELGIKLPKLEQKLTFSK